MLDDEPTTPSAESTPAPRSRRRSASRPAGPPGGQEAAAAPDTDLPGDKPAKATTKKAAKKATPPEAPTTPAAKPAKGATATKRAAKATTKATKATTKATKATTKASKASKEPAEQAGTSADAAGAPDAAQDAALETAAPARRSRKKAETPPTALLFQPPDPAAAAAEPAAEPAEPGGPEGADAEEGAGSGARRRRRRGGRGRRGRGGADGAVEGAESAEPDAAAAEGEQQSAAAADQPADGEEPEGSASRRRRRRRRRGGGADDGEESGGGAPDDPERTVVHVRQPRAKKESIGQVKGSTRLEAKKQRRREGREQGRRRPPVLSEAEFLARREAVDRVMVVRQVGERTQIAVLEDSVLVEHYVARASSSSMVGNVYLGKVQNVLPSMEAAFVEVGRGRNAVLYAGEVNWDAAGLDGQPKRIEHVMKSGDSVLVQVTKDPIGHKGARLTAQASLPGRYLVYVPDGSMTGISRKLPDTERSRLKGILKRIVPEDAGVIVRTAAEGASEEELQRDVTRLSAQWADLAEKAKSASAPALLYQEPDLTVRVVRDIFNEDFSRLVVSGDDAWDTVDAYVKHVAPDLADRLERWTGADDVFAAHRIDEQLAKALDRKVWLPSGGYLIIDPTEAMVVIDVNTGKFTGQGGNLEETVTKNNLEAAEEIVRQLRLRDIGGIVVIDFIDMVLESNRELVLRRLLECLGRDRTRHQVAEVTSLGLVQMTRKRVGQGLLEAFSTVCESCNGRGRHTHLEPVEPQRDKRDGGRESRRGGRRSAKVAEAGADEATKAAVAAVAQAAGRAAGRAAEAADQPDPAASTEPGESAESVDGSAAAPEPVSAAAAEPAEIPAEAPEPETESV